jgi:hypothetical protein
VAAIEWRIESHQILPGWIFMSEIIYLASPFSSPDPAVEEWRFEQAAKAAATLINEGHIVFSAIAHSFPIYRYGSGLPGHWDFWERFDKAFIDMCSRAIVLKLSGWQLSRGIEAEVALFEAQGKPVTCMEQAP